MRFKTKLSIIYGVLVLLTIPAFVYALTCHIMWVCIYAAGVAFLTVALSFFLLGELKERQRQVTSDIAHELRTPLACLRGQIEALQDGVYEPTKERLESCGEEIARLTSLVQDLSLLSDIEWENIALDKTEFDIAALLEKTAEEFRNEAEAKGLSIKLETSPALVHADYGRTKQIFVNLISNAVKYTEKGGITVGNAGREAFFADTGIGISSADIPRIFDRFWRADGARARNGAGGAGVGLTIARALARAQGGDIKAESELGKGSVFRVFF